MYLIQDGKIKLIPKCKVAISNNMVINVESNTKISLTDNDPAIPMMAYKI
ncbi:MAG: hypothetical protein P4M11_01240 [Candidatus Pacebacteria bacterium]|nr:hypothetical protein [Candidatus Paceibacterota bacterium]